MRKIPLAILLAIALLMSSCTCTAEKGTVSRLESQNEKLFLKYSAYVSKDDKLDAGAKDDELKLLQSIRDIVASLKRSLGD